jgi:hypothetical protein
MQILHWFPKKSSSQFFFLYLDGSCKTGIGHHHCFHCFAPQLMATMGGVKWTDIGCVSFDPDMPRHLTNKCLSSLQSNAVKEMATNNQQLLTGNLTASISPGWRPNTNAELDGLEIAFRTMHNTCIQNDSHESPLPVDSQSP